MGTPRLTVELKNKVDINVEERNVRESWSYYYRRHITNFNDCSIKDLNDLFRTGRSIIINQQTFVIYSIVVNTDHPSLVVNVRLTVLKRPTLNADGWELFDKVLVRSTRLPKKFPKSTPIIDNDDEGLWNDG